MKPNEDQLANQYGPFSADSNYSPGEVIVYKRDGRTYTGTCQWAFNAPKIGLLYVLEEADTDNSLPLLLSPFEIVRASEEPVLYQCLRCGGMHTIGMRCPLETDS